MTKARTETKMKEAIKERVKTKEGISIKVMSFLRTRYNDDRRRKALD
jgi:hypothetical protein